MNKETKTSTLQHGENFEENTTGIKRDRLVTLVISDFSDERTKEFYALLRFFGWYEKPLYIDTRNGKFMVGIKTGIALADKYPQMVWVFICPINTDNILVVPLFEELSKRQNVLFFGSAGNSGKKLVLKGTISKDEVVMFPASLSKYILHRFYIIGDSTDKQSNRGENLFDFPIRKKPYRDTESDPFPPYVTKLPEKRGTWVNLAFFSSVYLNNFEEIMASVEKMQGKPIGRSDKENLTDVFEKFSISKM